MDTATIDPVMHSRLAQRLTCLVDEADRLLHLAALKGTHEYDEARDCLREQVQQARQELVQVERTLLQKTGDAMRRGDRAVHEHPYAVIGAVAGIAALVGWLSRRD